MPERNRAAVHVCLLAIEPELLLNRQILCGKSFVDFDQIHVCEFKAGFLKCLQRSRHGTDAHDLRLNAGICPTYDATERLRSMSLGVTLAGDYKRGGAVNDSGGVSG